MTSWEFAVSLMTYNPSKPLWNEEEGLQTLIKDRKLPYYLPTPSSASKIAEHFIFPARTEAQQRQKLYDEMTINDNIVDGKGRPLVTGVKSVVNYKVKRMFDNRERYAAIARKFVNPGLQWWVVALLHEMECTQDFSRYLGNGQRWDKKTTIVPKGHGPFKSFEEGAIFALKYDKIDLIVDWSIGNVLYLLEGFNGYGYAKYRGINTPYLWSGSNQYTKGKYVTDGLYSSTAVSQQIGIALMLKRIMDELKYLY